MMIRLYRPAQLVGDTCIGPMSKKMGAIVSASARAPIWPPPIRLHQRVS